MNGNGEPAGQWKPCAACTQPLFVDPRGVRDSSTLGPPVWGGEGLLLPFVSICKERASSIFTSHPQLRLRTCLMGVPSHPKCAYSLLSLVLDALLKVGNHRIHILLFRLSVSPFLFLQLDLPPSPLYADAAERNIIPQVGLALRA